MKKRGKMLRHKGIKSPRSTDLIDGGSVDKIGVVFSCIIILCSCGCESRKPAPQSGREGTQAAAGRFVPTGSDPTVALDTQTGRLCRTTSTVGGHADLPQCGDGKAEQVEQVNVDPKVWENAEIAVTCSGKDHLLPTYPMDAKGEKNVVLNCTIKNLTNKTVPLAAPAKVDALLHLRKGQAVRVPSVYLGSNQHVIPARGEVREAGLFLRHHNCPARQSDYDCVQAELMNTSELLLTDTSNGVHYHMRIE
jgi:hypothetical protein